MFGLLMIPPDFTAAKFARIPGKVVDPKQLSEGRQRRRRRQVGAMRPGRRPKPRIGEVTGVLERCFCRRSVNRSARLTPCWRCTSLFS
jgi:hypothetical protein